MLSIYYFKVLLSMRLCKYFEIIPFLIDLSTDFSFPHSRLRYVLFSRLVLLAIDCYILSLNFDWIDWIAWNWIVTTITIKTNSHLFNQKKKISNSNPVKKIHFKSIWLINISLLFAGCIGTSRNFPCSIMVNFVQNEFWNGSPKTIIIW